jgi:hypothetical protein
LDLLHNLRYFKDIRSPPFNFDGDVSGDSSSDEEEDVSVNFLSYLRQTEEKGKTGYLQKRSARDPNLWRKRLCLVADFHMWCIHARHGRYRAKKIKLHGPIFLQEDLLPLEYPLGFGIKAFDSSYFFRCFDEEEQTNWTTELNEACKNEADNVQLFMADVLIGLEEQERNKRCSDSLQNLLSENLLSWLSREMHDDRTEGSHSDNEEYRWTIHSFHSYHPLCGKSMGFLMAVNEEYKDLFRKFVRPSPAAFWDCVVEIYKRYIASQIRSRSVGSSGSSNGRKPSLCYPETQILGETVDDGSISFFDPSYLCGARESTIKLQEILRDNVRWKTKAEILAETSLKSGMMQEKKKIAAEEAEAPVGWFSGWSAPKPVEVDYNSDLDRIVHGTDMRFGKSSRYSSKRNSCMGCASLDADAVGDVHVSEYILLKGHDSTRPDMALFDDIVRDVTVWLNSKEAKDH